MTFQDVGYGVSEHVGGANDHGLDSWTGDGTTNFVNSQFATSHNGWVDVQPLDGHECRGDSGGPLLQGDVVLAIHKLGSNYNFCTGIARRIRLDTAVHRAFLAEYVALP